MPIELTKSKRVDLIWWRKKRQKNIQLKKLRESLAIEKSIQHDKPYIYVAETPLKVTVCRMERKKAVMLAVEMSAFNAAAIDSSVFRLLGDGLRQHNI